MEAVKKIRTLGASIAMVDPRDGNARTLGRQRPVDLSTQQRATRTSAVKP